MVETIYDLFRQCTVCINIPGGQGTGFFVYPGAILSCAHVVEQTAREKITVNWQDKEFSPTEVTCLPDWESLPYRDLVLLNVPIEDHPCVFLDTLILPGDRLHSYGYPDSKGDSLTVEFSGPNNEGRMMTLKDEFIRPGFSGAPLLHRRSFKVCGLLKRSLGLRNRPLGGHGIPVLQIYDQFSNLREQNQAFHEQDKRWHNATAVTCAFWEKTQPSLSDGQSSEEKQPSQSGGQSPKEIIQSLWSLDYESQDKIFTTHTRRSRRAAAFVVQVEDSRLQWWLVARLAKKIPNVSNAKVFNITVPRHPMWKKRDFNELWLELSRKLKCDPDPKEVVAKLVKAYETDSVVIAMYEWSAAKRSQQLQQQVIAEFWTPLVKAVASLSSQPLRSRLILFLAEGNGTVTDIAPHDSGNRSFEDNDNAVVPIRLAPLVELTSEHVVKWMERDDVYALLKKLLSEEQIASLIREDILEWSSDPVKTLEQIFHVFDVKGFAKLETERLVG